MTDHVGNRPIRVWDLPIRLFHWSLAGLVALSWWTAHTDRLDWHRWSGYGILTLLVFRLFWGFIGSETARFTQFLRRPDRALAYLRHLSASRSPDRPTVGHNPLGGWSVVALLTLLIGQSVLGLFAVDTDGDESGPLADLLSFEAGRLAAHWHQTLFNVLLVLIGLHLAAILFYLLVKKDNLIGPMLTGTKLVVGPISIPRMEGAGRALLALLVAAIIVGTITKLPSLINFFMP